MSTPSVPSTNRVLWIEGDPTNWLLAQAQPVPPPWAGSSDPVALAVTHPLEGTLVLSPRRAGSAALVQPPPTNWIPCQLAIAHIYLPTPAGVSYPSPGYPLAPGTDLQALEQSLMAAMRQGTVLTVDATGYGGSSGALVLNGAVLPFAVLCPPNVA
jgi:hypothetical protein